MIILMNYSKLFKKMISNPSLLRFNCNNLLWIDIKIKNLYIYKINSLFLKYEKTYIKIIYNAIFCLNFNLKYK